MIYGLVLICLILRLGVSDIRNEGIRMDMGGEVKKFSSFASEWWKKDGPVRMLHAMTPLRLRYIIDHISSHFHGSPFRDISVLDLSCGGGILSIPMAKVGFNVTGLDPSAELIAVANHRMNIERELDEALKQSSQCVFMQYNVQWEVDESDSVACSMLKKQYDVLLVSEVVEHVEDLQAFLVRCDALLKEGGMIFFSTINKTLKALLQAKIAAEYILRLVAPGSHDWRKFVEPRKLVKGLMLCDDYSVVDISGVKFNPITRSFALSDDYDVNYFIMLHKS